LARDRPKNRALQEIAAKALKFAQIAWYLPEALNDFSIAEFTNIRPAYPLERHGAYIAWLSGQDLCRSNG
jgi:hypothetical protein